MSQGSLSLGIMVPSGEDIALEDDAVKQNFCCKLRILRSSSQSLIHKQRVKRIDFQCHYIRPWVEV